MTLAKFNKLSYDEKLFKVVDEGTFLDNYITENVRMNLYAVEKFYVELVYDSATNKIIEARSFKAGTELEKYTSHIKL